MAAEQEITSPYQHFVEYLESEKGLLSEKVEVSLELSKDFKTLIQAYNYQIRAIDDVKYTKWYRIIPEPIESIKNLHAWDAEGSLESRLTPESSNVLTTKLDIRFAKPVNNKDPYPTHFAFSYETPSHALIINQLFSRFMLFYYWYISTTKVKRLLINIPLSPNSKAIKTTPVVELTTRSPVIFEQLNILNKNLFSIVLVLKEYRLGYAFWKGAFFLLTPAVIAAFIQIPFIQIFTYKSFLILGLVIGFWIISGIIYLIYHKLLS